MVGRVNSLKVSRFFIRRLFAFACLLTLPVYAQDWTWQSPIGSTSGNSIASATYSAPLDTVLAVDMGGSVLSKVGDNGWTSTRLPGLVGLGLAHWTGKHFLIAGKDAKGHWHGISADGKNWNPVTALRGKFIVGFASSPDRTVALFDFDHVLVSKDTERKTWKKIRLPHTRRKNSPLTLYESVAYGNGTFVAMNSDGYVATSRDGERWILSTATVGDYFEGRVCFNGSFFAVRVEDELATSVDGKQWQRRTLPEGLSEVEGVISAGQTVLIFDEDRSTAFLTQDFANWTPLASDSDWTWVLDGAADGRAGLLFFGTGGRIHGASLDGFARRIADPGGLSGNDNYFLRHFAGWGDSLYAGGADVDGRYLSFVLKAGQGWTEMTNGIDHPERPVPRAFFQLPDGVVALAGEPAGFYRQQGDVWQFLGPAPSLQSGWKILSVARSPSGSAAVLTRSPDVGEGRDAYFKDYKVFLSEDWRQWRESGLSWRGDELADVDEEILHDGQRYIALLNPGKFFISSDGQTWSALPPIPDDTAAFQRKYYGVTSYKGFRYQTPRPNEPRRFASNGIFLVASCDKKIYGYNEKPGQTGAYSVSYNFIDQFFYFSFATGRWTSVLPPGADKNSSEASVVRWNGSAFLAAACDSRLPFTGYEGGSVYTSTDGLQWTRRSFPVGSNLRDLTWTGTGFAALTFGSSVLTHPTGMSPVLP